MPITDKMGKIGSLSVKCVLLTDKSSKKGPLSVNLDEILAELVEQHCIKKMPDKVSLYYILSSIQFKYKILTNKIRLDCGTALRSGRFLTHRHVSC